MSRKYKQGFRAQRESENLQKVSIMQSSLSRERVDSIENKLKSEIKGPGYYNPKLMFGKKEMQSITIPKEDRGLKPVPVPKVSSLDSQESQGSLTRHDNR